MKFFIANYINASFFTIGFTISLILFSLSLEFFLSMVREVSIKWSLSETFLNLGSFSLIAAGSLVTKSIAPFSLVMGSPAKEKNRICACGKTPMDKNRKGKEFIQPCCLVSLDPEMIRLASQKSIELGI